MNSLTFFLNVKLTVINSIVFQIPAHNNIATSNYKSGDDVIVDGVDGDSTIFQMPRHTHTYVTGEDMPKIIFKYNNTMEFTYDQANPITPLTFGLLFLMNHQFMSAPGKFKNDYLHIMTAYNIRFERIKRAREALHIMWTIISDNASDISNHVTYEYPGIEDNISLSSIYPIPVSIKYIINE